ncbi:hypothetical protein COT07_01385 [Candidatus Woesearchaeota archaeon CG07_land_8_20_14_0_80_44_23]|nr:MAG: hypothetical protein COT07_01385 [Candidatus Woesearchaeota archaeon CG07_land_8_20_14_0_80_44_23]
MNDNKIKSFDKIAKRYGRKSYDDVEYFIREKTFNEFREIIREDKIKDVLEAGCGNGRLSRKLACFNIKLACTDFSKEMLKEAKKRIGSGKNVRFVQADLRKMPFKSGSFDLAILSNVLINYDDKSAEDVIREMSRVVKRGGLFLLNFENLLSLSQSYMTLANYKNYRQGKLFSRTYLSGKIMKMLKRNGFHVDKIVPVRYEKLSPIMKREPLGRKAARITSSRHAFVSSLRYFLSKILIMADAIFRANAAYIIVARKEGR